LDTLADYAALGSGGCVIGDKLFYDFGYTGSNPTAANITVTATNAAFNPGLNFGGAWDVNGDTQIYFNVTVLPGGNAIEDDSLGISGIVLQGTGLISVGEDVCLGGVYSDPSAGTGCGGTGSSNLLAIDPGSPTVLYDDLNFNGSTYTTIGVFKDIIVSGNAEGSGTAQFSSISQNFSEVPEPVAVLLLGTCMFLLVPVLRRRLS